MIRVTLDNDFMSDHPTKGDMVRFALTTAFYDVRSRAQQRQVVGVGRHVIEIVNLYWTAYLT